MEIIKLKDRVIYRPSKGKKVKFAKDKSTYCEIVVGLNDNREILEVKE